MEGPVGYARHISNVDSAREGDLRVPKPECPPSHSHPVGHGTCVTSSMCNTIDFCLYASVFNMERYAEDVPHVTLFWPYRYTNTVSPPHYFPQRRTGRESRPHPSFTELITSRGAGVCPGNSAGGSKLLGLRGSALFSKILLFERSEFRIFGNGFSRFTES